MRWVSVIIPVVQRGKKKAQTKKKHLWQKVVCVAQGHKIIQNTLALHAAYISYPLKSGRYCRWPCFSITKKYLSWWQSGHILHCSQEHKTLILIPASGFERQHLPCHWMVINLLIRWSQSHLSIISYLLVNSLQSRLIHFYWEALAYSTVKISRSLRHR